MKKTGGQCRLTKSNTIVYSQYGSFGLTKGNALNKIINNEYVVTYFTVLHKKKHF